MIEESEAQSLIKLAAYGHELFKKVILSTPLPEDLTKTQIDIMITLYIEGPLSMSALSSRIGIAPEQATRALKNLRFYELVESERAEENRRIVIASLTEKGSRLMQEHTHLLHKKLDSTLNTLTQSEIRQLAKAGELITELLEKTDVKECALQHKPE